MWHFNLPCKNTQFTYYVLDSKKTERILEVSYLGRIWSLWSQIQNSADYTAYSACTNPWNIRDKVAAIAVVLPPMLMLIFSSI